MNDSLPKAYSESLPWAKFALQCAKRPQLKETAPRACASTRPAGLPDCAARITVLVMVLAIAACVTLPANAQVIQTIAAGVNPSASPSENACAPLTSVAPHGTDVYIASCAQIFKVDSAGTWTHVAGTGISAFSPDGTAASASANFDDIASLSLDSAGNIYFNEAFSNRVREIVAATGLIKTVAGTENLDAKNLNCERIFERSKVVEGPSPHLPSGVYKSYMEVSQ